MIKAIVFDYDGVIVNSFPGVYEVYKTICSQLGVPYPASIEDFKQKYGYNYKELLKNLGVTKDADLRRAQEIFAQEIVKQDPPLYPSIATVLGELHQKYRLFLITANLREEALQKLKKYNLAKYFSHVGGVEETNNTYGKRSEIKQVLEQERLNPNEVIYIGDRNIDYDVAYDVGISSIILVEYGWGFDRNYASDIQNIPVKRPLQILEAVQKLDR